MKTKILEVSTISPNLLQDALNSLEEGWRIENYMPLDLKEEDNDENILSLVNICLIICRESEKVACKYKVESLVIDKAKKRDGFRLGEMSKEIISKYELEGWDFVLMVPYIRFSRTIAYQFVFSSEKA